MALDTNKPLRGLKIDGVAKPILGQGVPQETFDLPAVPTDDNIGKIYAVTKGNETELYLIVEDED